STRAHTDITAHVRVGVEIAAIGQIENICNQAYLLAFGKVEILGQTHVPGEEVRLARRITIQQMRGAASTLDHRAVVIRELVDHTVTVDIGGRVSGIRQAAVSDEVAAPGEAVGQCHTDTRLELVSDVETVSAVVNVEVEGILRAEESIGVALTGIVAVISGPGVIGEPLK